MNPIVANKLMQLPEMREYCKWLGEEIGKINTIEADEWPTDPTLIAIEVRARKLALGKLVDILEPLLSAQPVNSGVASKEYTVDVEDVDKP